MLFELFYLKFGVLIQVISCFYLFFFSLNFIEWKSHYHFMHVHKYMCMWRTACVCRYVVQTLHCVFHVFLFFFLNYLLRQNPELTNSGQHREPAYPQILHLLLLKFGVMSKLSFQSCIYVDARALNPGPHACMAHIH